MDLGKYTAPIGQAVMGKKGYAKTIGKTGSLATKGAKLKHLKEITREQKKC